MKRVFLIILSILFLLFFSCESTPDLEETEELEVAGLLDESKEDEIDIEDAPDSLDTSGLESEDGLAENNIEEEQDDKIEESLANIQSRLDDLEKLLLDLYEKASSVEQAQEGPALEMASSVESAQTPPTVSEPQTPPVQTPEPVPQLEPPRQPPLPPPAMLGPAEENPPTQRETIIPRVEMRVSPVPENEPPTALTRNEIPLNPVVVPQDDNIVFSRTVRATVGQIIEIPFTGTGWIYMGELASRRGIVYNSTRRDLEGQSIIFGAEEAGTYVLRFFRENFLSGYIQNDYVQVIVGDAPAVGGTGWFAPPYDRGRVVALPRWPSALDAGLRESQQSSQGEESLLQSIFSANDSGLPSSSLQETTPSQIAAAPQDAPSSTGTYPPQGEAIPQGIASLPQSVLPQGAAQGSTASGEPEIINPELVLQRAENAFDAGNVAAAIALLDQLKDYYPNGTDELYWLYGQFYEANSPNRNILHSLDYYRRLVNEYPQSSRYNAARSRIAYLERFYINIQ